MNHVYDFYKPDLHSEYPEVDGPLSNTCYLRAVDECYKKYLSKAARKDLDVENIEGFDFFLFHSPYAKLVQKSFGRLAYNDFLRTPDDPKFAQMQHLREISIEDSFTNKDIEKAFVAHTKSEFEARVLPTLLCSKNMGNLYCGSLYSGLCSLISEIDSERLVIVSNISKASELDSFPMDQAWLHRFFQRLSVDRLLQ